MACALARSLVERGGYESEAALANYVRWLKTDPPDIGITRLWRSAIATTRTP